MWAQLTPWPWPQLTCWPGQCWPSQHWRHQQPWWCQHVADFLAVV